MKQILALWICSLVFSAPLSSQGTKDDLMKQITQETCQEVKKVDFSNKTAEEVKIALGLPLVLVASRHQAELKALGINISDSQSAQRFGNDMGVFLLQGCPDFVVAMMKNPNTISEITQSSRRNSSGSISGTLIRIVGGDFSHLQVEDRNGRVEKLWWMEYFDGSNALAADPQSRLNKPVKVNYIEKEIFNATLKDYVKIKVITGIE